jgi:hypothetical protein
VPGVVDASTGVVVRSVNIPGLEGTNPVGMVASCLLDGSATTASMDGRLTRRVWTSN